MVAATRPLRWRGYRAWTTTFIMEVVGVVASTKPLRGPGYTETGHPLGQQSDVASTKPLHWRGQSGRNVGSVFQSSTS